jgi:hypothetical protein
MKKAAQIMDDYAFHHLAVSEHEQMSIHDYYKYLVLKHPN